MTDKKIYIISVFEKMDTKTSNFDPDGKPIADIGCCVVNGWYFKKEDAESVIENNFTDIWETCYNYAVLEECNEGMYDFDRERTYYKYNREIDGYEKMDMKDVPKAFLCPAYSISRIGM